MINGERRITSSAYFSAREIINIFLVDQSELSDGSTPVDVYQRKLRESKKIGSGQQLLGRNYGYGQYSLYQSIKTHWIKEPIIVNISTRLIYDGLHRIACAYDIDMDRKIRVDYVF